MENLLNEAQTVGVFAVFAILVIREVFAHINRRNGGGPERTEKQIDDLSRWLVPRIEEAIGKIAESQEQQTRLLESLAELLRDKKGK